MNSPQHMTDDSDDTEETRCIVQSRHDQHVSLLLDGLNSRLDSVSSITVGEPAEQSIGIDILQWPVTVEHDDSVDIEQEIEDATPLTVLTDRSRIAAKFH